MWTVAALIKNPISRLARCAVEKKGVTQQNFIALFVHNTFTVRSQNTIYSDYNGLFHQHQD